jgi:hypothetical protein
MRLSALGLILALGILTAPLAVEAQPPTKVHRIGYFSQGSALPEFAPHVEAFRQGCVSLAMWRARTSSLSTVMRKGAQSGFATWQPSSSGSKWR